LESVCPDVSYSFRKLDLVAGIKCKDFRMLKENDNLQGAFLSGEA
jgi:hypothetical protein